VVTRARESKHAAVNVGCVVGKARATIDQLQRSLSRTVPTIATPAPVMVGTARGMLARLVRADRVFADPTSFELVSVRPVPVLRRPGAVRWGL
jgi:hypothetical protein